MSPPRGRPSRARSIPSSTDSILTVRLSPIDLAVITAAGSPPRAVALVADAALDRGDAVVETVADGRVDARISSAVGARPSADRRIRNDDTLSTDRHSSTACSGPSSRSASVPSTRSSALAFEVTGISAAIGDLLLVIRRRRARRGRRGRQGLRDTQCPWTPWSRSRPEPTCARPADR